MVTTTLYTSKDATIDESDPDNNYGSETSLSVDDMGSYENRVYMEYDISSLPANHIISSAIFHYCIIFGNDRDDTVRFQRTTSQFDESTITWNSNKPSTTSIHETDVSISGDDGWHQVDLTTIFADAYNAGLDYFGVYMRALTDNGNHVFSSKEGANDPYIVVTHIPADTIYVDIASGDDANDGSTWALAKQTINAGINALAAGGVLHIGFGDYSSQAAITFDKTMSLLCETAGTGGGTGTVVLPPTS